ncbi:MAG: hypothetical protein J6T86_07580 [Bacteroidales bacterium]|nr:hypothetical protein [Bacteroidales bacterium]
MHTCCKKTTPRLVILMALMTVFTLQAQEPQNEFTIDAKINTRGEVRVGGFDPEEEASGKTPKALFVMGQYRLNVGYKRADWFEVRLSPQFSGIWGQSGGNLSLAEGWFSMRHQKTGLFAKIGRQTLEYDDERILGYDDWTMTAPTHDVLKFGYEGHGHKVHGLLAYNQNSDNVSSGTSYYAGGIQPYKTMQALWYHYETPKSLFGISLIGMNVGMQSQKTDKPDTTFYQQLVGSYLFFKPSIVSLEGAFYYQLGKEEHGIPLDAYMGSAKLKITPNDKYNLYVGYDYLSGDKFFAVPAEGTIGMIYHDKIRGFCPIFGSHHDFYGAMDFFYVESYVGGFTPGLQNLYTGGSVRPVKGLNINAAYHFFAIATNHDYLKKPLGHEIEFSLDYSFGRFVKVGAGYSYMRGTETMEILQRVSRNRQLHWGWIMISVTPTLFTTGWDDKKRP